MVLLLMFVIISLALIAWLFARSFSFSLFHTCICICILEIYSLCFGFCILIWIQIAWLFARSFSFPSFCKKKSASLSPSSSSSKPSSLTKKRCFFELVSSFVLVIYSLCFVFLYLDCIKFILYLSRSEENWNEMQKMRIDPEWYGNLDPSY